MPTLPAAYGLFFLTVMRDRGHAEAEVLAGTGLSANTLQDPHGRLSSDQYLTLLSNLLRCSGDPSLCYELGLRSQLTKHGFVGFGLMSCATLGEAITLGQRYLHARVPLFRGQLRLEAGQCLVDLEETVPLAALREFALSFVAVELCCLFGRLDGNALAPRDWQMDILLPFPEPAFYAAWRDRLPRIRFDQPATQIRFPARHLERPFITANPVAAEMAIAQCEQELVALREPDGDVRAQVVHHLVCQHGHYPDLATVARQLCLSERTLKRRLLAAGVGFQALLDTVREADSRRLLANLQLPVEHVAAAVGYRDPANFTRAFRKWTGQSPRDYRAALRAARGPN